MVETMPTVAIGTDLTVLTVAVGTNLTVSTVFLCRRLTCWPGRNGSCADGLDILPSAQNLAVSNAARSRSERSLISSYCIADTLVSFVFSYENGHELLPPVLICACGFF
jgi:hypothetical protein